jgi:hypothetical protein
VAVKRDNSIAVALIGAGAVVIAALIGYLATHQNKRDADIIGYTGNVKDAKSLKPIGNALVAITEDQKVPQRFTADSEGVFFAQLSKDTQTMLLEVKAEGYKDYSRRGPTVRTGSENVFLEPLPPPPTPEQDASETALERLRELHKVLLISPQFDEKPLTEVPKNSYGFAGSGSLLLKPYEELTLLHSRDIEGGWLLFELHKLSDGHIELVGFVGPETYGRYRMGLKSGAEVTIYSMSLRDAHDLVSVPFSSLICPKERYVAVGMALDCNIR